MLDASYIRVATEKIDLLVNLVGELVITEAMLARSGALAEEASDARYASNGGLADLLAPYAQPAGGRARHPHAADLERLFPLPAAANCTSSRRSWASGWS